MAIDLAYLNSCSVKSAKTITPPQETHETYGMRFGKAPLNDVTGLK